MVGAGGGAPPGVRQWEYAHDSRSTNDADGLVQALNALGAGGMEVVGFASADKTIGNGRQRRIDPPTALAPPPTA